MHGDPNHDPDVLQRLAVLEASATPSWRREAKDHTDEIAALNQRIKQLETKLAGADARAEQAANAAINRRVPGLIMGGIEPVIDEVIALEKRADAEGERLQLAMEPLRASAGASALTAKNAATSVVSAAEQYLAGSASAFVHGEG